MADSAKLFFGSGLLASVVSAVVNKRLLIVINPHQTRLFHSMILMDLYSLHTSFPGLPDDPRTSLTHLLGNLQVDAGYH